MTLTYAKYGNEYADTEIGWTIKLEGTGARSFRRALAMVAMLDPKPKVEPTPPVGRKRA